jgi:Ca2+-binding RTX toxin-like protein
MLTRARLITAVSVPVLVAALLSGASAAAGDQARPTCLGARATIVGTAKADVLRGTQRRDVVVGLGGADRILGRGGDDLLCGGAGNDRLDGGPGRNRLDGGAGRDECLRAARITTCEPKPLPYAPPIDGTTFDGDRLTLSRASELAYLGLNVADTPEEGRKFVDKYGWDWPSIHDRERLRARALGATYQPHVVAIDARGRIVGRHKGGGVRQDWEELAAKLR